MTELGNNPAEKTESENLKKELFTLLQLSGAGRLQELRKLGVPNTLHILFNSYIYMAAGQMTAPEYDPAAFADPDLAEAWSEYFNLSGNPSESFKRVHAVLSLMRQFIFDFDAIAEEFRTYANLTDAQKNIIDVAAKSIDKNWWIFHNPDDDIEQ